MNDVNDDRLPREPELTVAPDESIVSQTTADCYSAGERESMVWFQNIRARLLAPILRMLGGVGVTADQLTCLALLAGLAFCPLYFVNKIAAFMMLLLHVAIDGLDGPLARHKNVASRAGSFTDTMSDQIVVVAVTVTMMLGSVSIIGIIPGCIYIFLYTIVVVFAMVRNAMGIPYSWVIRPRFVVYIFVALEVFLFDGTSWSGTINWIIWFFNGLFLVKLITGFLKIRAKL